MIPVGLVNYVTFEYIIPKKYKYIVLILLSVGVTPHTITMKR